MLSRSCLLLVLPVLALGALTQPRSPAAGPGDKVYELRIITAAPGKLDAIVAEYRDHISKLHEKHGVVNVGYWTAEPDDGKLYSILAYASRDAVQKSIKAVVDDPEWKEVVKQTEANGGKIIANVGLTFLAPTDYSPPVKAPSGSHVYELRTYTAEPGRRDALNARFRDHTLKLFARHGITNVGYWLPLTGQKNADDTLIYLLAHKDMAAAKKSWQEFRADPDWVAARKASEEKAGGSLTVANGVKSVYLKPTDFSPMK
jgi:hypothetical protein